VTSSVMWPFDSP